MQMSFSIKNVEDKKLKERDDLDEPKTGKNPKILDFLKNSNKGSNLEPFFINLGVGDILWKIATAPFEPCANIKYRAGYSQMKDNGPVMGQPVQTCRVPPTAHIFIPNTTFPKNLCWLKRLISDCGVPPGKMEFSREGNYGCGWVIPDPILISPKWRWRPFRLENPTSKTGFSPFRSRAIQRQTCKIGRTMAMRSYFGKDYKLNGIQILAKGSRNLWRNWKQKRIKVSSTGPLFCDPIMYGI